MKRKAKARFNKKRFISAAFCLVFGVYLFTTLIITQMEIVSRRQELDLLTVQAQTQQLQIDELKHLVNEEDDLSYVERIARERLNFAAPDERVYIDISGK